MKAAMHVQAPSDSMAKTTGTTQHGVCDLTMSRYTGERPVAYLLVDRNGKVSKSGLEIWLVAYTPEYATC
eukprot:scaffold93958_cov38-Prasinocladus_malaysianus.AAC.1